MTAASHAERKAARQAADKKRKDAHRKQRGAKQK